MGRDIHKAAAAGRQIGPGPQPRDIDAAIAIHLQEGQQRHIEAPALEIGELLGRGHDGIGIGRAAKGKAQQRHAADGALLYHPGHLAMQALLEQDARHIGRNAKAQVGGMPVRQFHGGAARNHLLGPPGLGLEAGQRLRNLPADGRVVHRLRGLPLIGIDHHMVHQMAGDADIVRPQVAGPDDALDLGDDDATVVACGHRLLQRAQQRAFVLIAQVAALIGRGGAQDGHVGRHSGKEQPVAPVEMLQAHYRMAAGRLVHRAALLCGIDKGAHARLGQHARAPRSRLAVHVEQDAAGDVVGLDLVVHHHAPDRRHGQRGRAAGI